MNAYVVHRSKEIFGEVADKYRPERWLDDHTRFMDRHMFQVSEKAVADSNELGFGEQCALTSFPSLFGAGPYTCMGRHISLLEMDKVTVELVRNYRIILANPDFEMNPTNRWFLKPGDLPCYFHVKKVL